ncbi:Sbal_3080 family lipoprotein [Pseudocolwellia sp. HL-MZ19]|uniref:Sbal_3080 family lipoprotein n=1 Tax=unclassified Pseudocolwellia TaxID=2848178 RepID=UPI003CEAD84D
MKYLLTSLILVLTLSGCSGNGMSNVKQLKANDFKQAKTQIVMIEDDKQRKSVKNVLSDWMISNGYDVADYEVRVIEKLKDGQVLFKYNANWWWDVASYMRYANLELIDKNGSVLASVDFDSVKYGGMDKFGDAERRLKILMEVLMNEMDTVNAEKCLELGCKN